MDRTRSAWRRRGFDAVLLAASFSTAAGIVAGFFGDALPFFDSLGQLRAHAAAVLVAMAAMLAVRRYVLAGFACLLTAALAFHAVLPFMIPARMPDLKLPDAIPRYTLLQMNVRRNAVDRTKAVARIVELDPDVVTLQEVTRGWDAALSDLRERYPYQDRCAPPRRNGDAAILSRRPFVEPGVAVCDTYARFVARSIDFDGKTVVIGSQHLSWPWPFRQGRQLDRLAPILAGLGGARLVAGDFNAAPWSAAIARYAGSSGTRVVAGIGPTYGPIKLPSFVARFGGLPIDNVLASREVLVLEVERPEATSSDHLPVLVTFTLPFAPAPPLEVQSVAR